MPEKDAFELALAFGYLSYSEVIGLKAIAQMLPTHASCMNLGAGSGTSALAVCEDRPDIIATFRTIDIAQSNPYGGLDNETNAFNNAGVACPVHILGDTVEIAKTWTEPLDYLFIDDDHGETHLRDEIRLWLPFLKPNGIIAFHDYGAPVWGGVKTVIDDLMVPHPLFQPLFLFHTMFAFRRGLIFSKESYAPNYGE
jgi:Methyltransferase domain